MRRATRVGGGGEDADGYSPVTHTSTNTKKSKRKSSLGRNVTMLLLLVVVGMYAVRSIGGEMKETADITAMVAEEDAGEMYVFVLK